jgi:hypothetical protein
VQPWPRWSLRCSQRQQPGGHARLLLSWSGDTPSDRAEHTATLLNNGKVLVAGGRDHDSAETTAEAYDPASGSWSFAGIMSNSRYAHTATRLPNGKVLVSGGSGTVDTKTAELYTP